jgi:hypothetical protein
MEVASISITPSVDQKDFKDKRIEELEAQLKVYEENGAAKLYYSLNRKMNEMADLMNDKHLSKLDITDSKDKSFERLQKIWTDAASIAQAVKSLGEIAGVTGDEKKDVERKPFNDRIADSRS